MKTGESISRIRNILKAVKEDSFLTDRLIYSLIMKYAKTLMQRDLKLVNLFKNSSLFKEDPCVVLIDVDRVAACCIDINTGCTFKRSKDKLPTITNLSKYNKRKYYWFIDGYLYIPDVDWEGVRVQAMFEEIINKNLCGIDEKNICIPEQERDINIPDYLFSEIENLARQEFLTAGQIPSDGADDSQNVMR